MASLQHVTEGGRDAWRVRPHLAGYRKTIGLGAVSESQARDAAEHLDELIHCKARLKQPPKETRRWLDGISNELHQRIANRFTGCWPGLGMESAVCSLSVRRASQSQRDA